MDPPPLPAVPWHHHRQTDGARCADTWVPGTRDHGKPELRCLIAGLAGEKRPAAQPRHPGFAATPTQPAGGQQGREGWATRWPRGAETDAWVIYSGWQEDNSFKLKITPKPQHKFQLTADSQRSKWGGS